MSRGHKKGTAPTVCFSGWQQGRCSEAPNPVVPMRNPGSPTGVSQVKIPVSAAFSEVAGFQTERNSNPTSPDTGEQARLPHKPDLKFDCHFLRVGQPAGLRWRADAPHREAISIDQPLLAWPRPSQAEPTTAHFSISSFSRKCALISDSSAVARRLPRFRALLCALRKGRLAYPECR